MTKGKEKIPLPACRHVNGAQSFVFPKLWIFTFFGPMLGERTYAKLYLFCLLYLHCAVRWFGMALDRSNQFTKLFDLADLGEKFHLNFTQNIWHSPSTATNFECVCPTLLARFDFEEFSWKLVNRKKLDKNRLCCGLKRLGWPCRLAAFIRPDKINRLKSDRPS